MSEYAIMDFELACLSIQLNPKDAIIHPDWIIKARGKLWDDDFWGIVRKYSGAEEAINKSDILK